MTFKNACEMLCRIRGSYNFTKEEKEALVLGEEALNTLVDMEHLIRFYDGEEE